MQTNGNADKIFAVQTKKKSNSNSLPCYIDSSRKTADGDDQQVVGLLADQQSSFAASWISLSAHTPWTVHANHSGSCSFPLLSLIHKFGCVCIYRMVDFSPCLSNTPVFGWYLNQSLRIDGTKSIGRKSVKR